MNAPQEKIDHAKQNAEGWASSIAAMVAALECDYDRLEELRTELADLESEAKDYTNSVQTEARAALAAWREENDVELSELTEAATIDGDKMENADAARQRIQESVLSVEVRSDWHEPCASEDDDARKPAEFCILLSTGGPALRILGELDEHGQPTRAWLEYQDWGTPWTHHYIKDFANTLLAFCQQFYFGG